ncbi:ABC transporter ATP-binding protein [Limibacillus halophilus]|uniref:ABC-type Fe3+/spermidine/putrescine transport system ATPase subunit n=1 Tax=Limibacillus halophilus TaxID=1579333 RepID=A0A839SX65_9PROT|nr:ABC transporter ATP-binding protein [Limibacillus halophilus]MBB3066126.1 ABC-type Fe3+/spermidine/putrescine transport system ATPase subunit [Limibacillus halophilus]
MSSLEINNLHLWYGAFHALRGVDLSIGEGDFLALVGPSGCGKTSLLRSIAGFVHPRKGSIKIGGQDVLRLKPRERNLGMVFQHFALFPHMTAAENVAFGMKCRAVPGSEINDRVKRALDMVGLGQFADRKPRQLSGGQQQRVALARALVIEPNILLLDEPLGALDKKLRIQMQTELQLLQKRLGVTAVFVTHDQEEAMAMADRIAIMRDGELEQLGTPKEIFTAPRTPWAAEFIGSGNVLKGRVLAGENGKTAIDLGAGCDFSLGQPPGTGADEDVTVFVQAEDIRLEPTAGTEGLEVISHRYLGLYVEVMANYRDGVIKALLSPGEAEGVAVGARVIARADAARCKVMEAR